MRTFIPRLMALRWNKYEWRCHHLTVDLLIANGDSKKDDNPFETRAADLAGTHGGGLDYI